MTRWWGHNICHFSYGVVGPQAPNGLQGPNGPEGTNCPQGPNDPQIQVGPQESRSMKSMRLTGRIDKMVWS